MCILINHDMMLNLELNKLICVKDIVLPNRTMVP
jgi:hypothetical protein